MDFNIPIHLVLFALVGIAIGTVIYFCLPTYKKELDRAIESKKQEIAAMSKIADENLCCCGDSMDHSPWDFGHQPVSMRKYMLEPLERQLVDLEKERAALK